MKYSIDFLCDFLKMLHLENVKKYMGSSVHVACLSHGSQDYML